VTRKFVGVFCAFFFVHTLQRIGKKHSTRQIPNGSGRWKKKQMGLHARRVKKLEQDNAIPTTAITQQDVRCRGGRYAALSRRYRQVRSSYQFPVKAIRTRAQCKRRANYSIRLRNSVIYKARTGAQDIGVVWHGFINVFDQYPPCPSDICAAEYGQARPQNPAGDADQNHSTIAVS
jgi:hypothetical protein